MRISRRERIRNEGLEMKSNGWEWKVIYIIWNRRFLLIFILRHLIIYSNWLMAQSLWYMLSRTIFETNIWKWFNNFITSKVQSFFGCLRKKIAKYDKCKYLDGKYLDWNDCYVYFILINEFLGRLKKVWNIIYPRWISLLTIISKITRKRWKAHFKNLYQTYIMLDFYNCYVPAFTTLIFRYEQQIRSLFFSINILMNCVLSFGDRDQNIPK